MITRSEQVHFYNNIVITNLEKGLSKISVVFLIYYIIDYRLFPMEKFAMYFTEEKQRKKWFSILVIIDQLLKCFDIWIRVLIIFNPSILYHQDTF